MEKITINTITEKVNRFLEFVPENKKDVFTERKLQASAIEYFKSKHQYLGDIEIKVNKRPYDCLLDAMYDEEELSELSLAFTNMTLDPVWGYDIPTRRVKVNEHSKGGILAYPSEPTKIDRQWSPFTEPIRQMTMFRLMFTRYYIPTIVEESEMGAGIRSELEPPHLATPKKMWTEVRKGSVVPFEVRLLAYSQVMRFSYRIDLFKNKLIKDFRDGKIPVTQRQVRNPLEALYLDRMLSTNKLPELQKQIFEFIFEGRSLGASEIAHGFKITDDMARNHIGGLVKRELVYMEGVPPGETYHANMEKINELKGNL